MLMEKLILGIGRITRSTETGKFMFDDGEVYEEIWKSLRWGLG